MVSAPFSYAQTVNPCPSGTGFNNLCGVNQSSVPTVISVAITVLLVGAALLFLFWPIYALAAHNEKSRFTQFRTALIGAIVGLVLVFLSFFILQLVLNLFKINLTDLVLPQI